MSDDRLTKLNRIVAHHESKRQKLNHRLSILTSRLAIIKDGSVHHSREEITMVEKQIAETEATLVSVEKHIYIYDRRLRAYLQRQHRVEH